MKKDDKQKQWRKKTEGRTDRKKAGDLKWFAEDLAFCLILGSLIGRGKCLFQSSQLSHVLCVKISIKINAYKKKKYVSISWLYLFIRGSNPLKVAASVFPFYLPFNYYLL